MKLQAGMVMTTEDLANFFKISPRTLTNKEKRGRYEEKLRDYCDFVQRRGKRNKILYEIGEVYIEEGPEDKKTYEKNLEIYKEKALDIIKNDSLQTYSSIASHLGNTGDLQRMNHSRSTAVQYVSKGVKDMFGKKPLEGGDKGCITARIWCQKTEDENEVITYTPLTAEALDFFTCLLKEGSKELDAELGELYSSWKAREITRKEYCELVGTKSELRFDKVFSTFKQRYHFFPISVPRYMVNGAREPGYDF